MRCSRKVLAPRLRPSPDRWWFYMRQLPASREWINCSSGDCGQTRRTTRSVILPAKVAAFPAPRRTQHAKMRQLGSRVISCRYWIGIGSPPRPPAHGKTENDNRGMGHQSHAPGKSERCRREKFLASVYVPQQTRKNISIS